MFQDFRPAALGKIQIEQDYIWRRSRKIGVLSVKVPHGVLSVLNHINVGVDRRSSQRIADQKQISCIVLNDEDAGTMNRLAKRGE